MRRLIAIIALTALAFTSALAQAPETMQVAPTPSVLSALAEIPPYVKDGTTCDAPSEVWRIQADPSAAIDWVRAYLEKHTDWMVAGSRQLDQSYAIAIDPDPSDPHALILAGVIDYPSPDGHPYSEFFWAKCNIP